MSVIDQIAKLIEADPNVTARQIAKALGYAEEKSVYYWLSKAGYNGIKDFKKALLKKALPSPKRPDTPIARDADSGSFSFFSDREQKALGVDLQDHLDEHLGGDSYCVLLSEYDYEPLASLGDVLLIDPDAPSYQGDLQWACVRGKMRLVRQFETSAENALFVDAIKPGLLVSPDFVSGKVVFILRKYV